LEVSLPKIVERLPETAAIDNSATASITDGQAVTYETEGGSVTVEQKPLLAIRPGNPTHTAATAEPPRADGSSFGVAVGFPFAPEEAEAEWQDLVAKVGTLLIGLEPVLTAPEEGEGVVIVAGPIPTEAQAAALCGRLDHVGIPCAPAPFRGEPLPLLN
ncbi:MAG TPA: SPOR domain-containing protein, partial [Alphaproteobacteria bacterium]|nr:SPOR domain-containing protein [Alphaproteobacteria bacterium]